MALKDQASLIRLELTATGNPASGDEIDVADATIDSGIESLTVPEKTGSLDTAPPIPGAAKPTMAIRHSLKGTASAVTAPQCAKLLQIAGLEQAAVTVVPSASTSTASAGTATTFTIDRTAGN